MGIGALIGALFIATNGTSNWLRPRVGFGAFFLSAGIGLLAMSHTLALSMAAMAVCGLCSSLLLSGSNSLIQLQVPQKLRGRAMSIFSTTLMGLNPFAALVAGSAAQQFGLGLSLSVSAAVLALVSVAYLRQHFKN
jgi:MFS family permease